MLAIVGEKLILNPEEARGLGATEGYDSGVVLRARAELEATTKVKARAPERSEILADDELFEDLFDGNADNAVEEIEKEGRKFRKHPFKYLKNKAVDIVNSTLEEMSLFKESPSKYLVGRAPKLILRAALGILILSPTIILTAFPLLAPILIPVQSFFLSVSPLVTWMPGLVGYVTSKLPKKETMAAGVGASIGLYIGGSLALPLAMAGALTYGLYRSLKSLKIV